MGSPVTAILGLGREVGDAAARRFHEIGHNVLAADSSGDRLLTAQNAMPEKVLLHLGDLHTKLGLRNAVAAAVEGFGRIDNLVVIPSIEQPDSIHDFSQEKFDKALAKTVRGAAQCLKVFAERIADQADLPTAGAERIRHKPTHTTGGFCGPVHGLPHGAANGTPNAARRVGTGPGSDCLSAECGASSLAHPLPDVLGRTWARGGERSVAVIVFPHDLFHRRGLVVGPLPQDPRGLHAIRMGHFSLVLHGLPMEPLGEGVFVVIGAQEFRGFRFFPVGALRVGV